jgi:hypothetical protein
LPKELPAALALIYHILQKMRLAHFLQNMINLLKIPKNQISQLVRLWIVTNTVASTTLSGVLSICSVEDSLGRRKLSNYSKVREITSMSQQEMQFENVQPGETGSYDSGYEAFPRRNSDYEASHYKISVGGVQSPPDDAHLREHRLNLRMGMAVISLIFWMGLFLISLAILLNNPTRGIIQLFVFMGVGIFTVFVIFANILINRK